MNLLREWASESIAVQRRLQA